MKPLMLASDAYCSKLVDTDRDLEARWEGEEKANGGSGWRAFSSVAW